MTDPGTDVAVVDPSRELVAQVRSPQFQQQIELALPGNVTPARFVRATVTALLQNPDLAVADRDSVFVAAIKAAQDGLLPDGREAALVIYNTKVKGPNGDAWVKKAQYLPMVAGYRKIAAEHGWTIRSAVVYEHDEFEYELGLDPKLTHRPAPLRTDRGKLVYAYAVGVHTDGRREFEVMGADEIAKVRAASRASERGPWVDWEERMWEKSAARRLFTKLPLDRTDDRVSRMLEASRENAADLLYGPDGAAHTATPALPAGATPATHAAPEQGGAAEPGEPEAPGDTAGGQQADAGQPAAADPAPVPGDDDDDGPTLASAFTPPAAVIDAAAATQVPRGPKDVKGKALSEIAADAHGADWLLWAMSKAPGYWPAVFRDALELFVQHRAPDVWAKYVEQRDAA